MHRKENQEPGKLIKSDVQLWEELSYCVPLGIPHSTFLAWPDDDQDKALLFKREQADYCQCGVQRSALAEDPSQFAAVWEQCPGCELLEMERDNVPEGMKGVTFRLVTIEEAARITAGQEGVTSRRETPSDSAPNESQFRGEPPKPTGL